MKRYLDGHVGELILLCAFLVSLVSFTVIYAVKGVESQLLGGVTLAALSSLATYMQKRGTQLTTNVETARDVVSNPPKKEEE